MSKFEFIEHTADIGIRIKGKTLKELFSHSAESLFSLITSSSFKSNKTRKIELSDESLEGLLVAWLNELLSVFYTYGFLPISYKIDIESSSNSLRAKVKGAKVDLYNIELKEEIKAATYHNVKIEQSDKGYTVEIIFDV